MGCRRSQARQDLAPPQWWQRVELDRSILALLLWVGMLFAVPARAAVERLEILEREPFAAQTQFGQVGAYEKITGRLHFVLDPELPANRRIVDLALAPRDELGRVRFVGDFVLLRPADLARGNHRLIYEVTNRGNLGMLAMFNDAAWSNDPTTIEDAGNGFLLRQGYSLLWSAWNWDVVPGEGRLQIALPIATERGRPITGPVAAEFVVDTPSQTAPFMWGDSRGYPPLALDQPDAKLSVRDEPGGTRIAIPREQWQFARLEAGRVVPDPTAIYYAPGFQPGRIYEVVYTATAARVVGLGLAAIRDTLAFFRFAPTDRVGTANPLAEGNRIDPTAGLIFGISQSGRVIQHMLWQGFHLDEAGRMVFEGAWIHVAGAGKGSFNHRFAQTTRHPSQLEDQQYPADFFPFTTTPETDPVTGEHGDVLAVARAAGAVPKLFYTATSTEYWTRAASLLHTDVAGTRDVALHPEARLYFVAGAQHGVWQWPERGLYRHCTNPLDHRPVMRALLGALDRWVTEDRSPPASRYPTLADGTLGSVAAYRAAFPAIPAAAPPRSNLQPPRLDLGPRFAKSGIVDRQPAGFGRPFVTRVPLPDDDGIDRGGVRLPAVVWPLGTHTGWNPRRPEVGAADQLARWSGSFLTFAIDEATRVKAGDPRRSLARRYRSRADYEAKIEIAARASVEQGFLLDDEVAAVTAAAGAFYDRVTARRLGDPSCHYTMPE